MNRLITHMKYLFIFIILIPLGIIRAQNNLVQISGELHDRMTGEALVGAIIQVKDASQAVTSDASGKFASKAPLKFPVKLSISSIGYETQEFVLETLTLGNINGSNEPDIRSVEIIPARPSVLYIISASPTISDLTLSSKI